MKKNSLLLILTAVTVLGAAFGYKVYTIRRTMAAMAAVKPPPVVVSATAVVNQTWPNTISAVGSLASFRGITVKTEVEGLVRLITAESGRVVAEGDELIQLDTSVEDAQLSGLEAQARLAELNVGRSRELRANGTNTPNELDTAEATLASARASVAQLKANLAKKHITAPFAGRLGIVHVHPGQFLSKGDAIVVLESIDPIHLDFSLPQQEVARVVAGQTVRLRVDAYPDRMFNGQISAISPRIDDATRNLDVRATLPNPDGALRPGMFARAEIMLQASEESLILPSAAVVYNPYGETVYVIENSIAHQRFITTGSTRGNLTQIHSGLKSGEQVVTAGQIKLRNGSAVQVDNTSAPDADPAPKPQES